jgi:hypothetical protein
MKGRAEKGVLHMSNEALELSDYKFLGGEKANLIGGSESDRQQLLKLLDDYLVVNAKIDWESLLKNIWSQRPILMVIPIAARSIGESCGNTTEKM